jgi:putative transposase
MNSQPQYYGHRVPPEVITYSVWRYHRFTLSFRGIEDLLAERGVIVSCESIRQWCKKFGPGFAKRLRNKKGKLGDTWYADEVFIKINGELRYQPRDKISRYR